MPGTSRQSGHEAGSALLSLHQEDQENVNPKRVAPARRPREQMVLKAGNVRGPRPQQRLRTRWVAPLKDFPVNDEHGAAVPSWKAVSKQPAFTIHVDEAEETQKKPAELKETECEYALAFNAAVSLPRARKPLTPLDYPIDGSFESLHVMDMSIVLEDEKPVNVNKVPDYQEDIHAGQWWRTPLLPALGRQRQMDF